MGIFEMLGLMLCIILGSFIGISIGSVIVSFLGRVQEPSLKRRKISEIYKDMDEINKRKPDFKEM